MFSLFSSFKELFLSLGSGFPTDELLLFEGGGIPPVTGSFPTPDAYLHFSKIGLTEFYTAGFKSDNMA